MSGADRDAGAALARAAALELELEELRTELAQLRDTTSGRPKEPEGSTEDTVRRLKDEIVNLRAENELLRSGQHAAETARTKALGSERDGLRREIVGLKNVVTELTGENERLRAQLSIHQAHEGVPLSDNRDAVIKRLHEERADLARALDEARTRYEAEPPASRDPKTLEDRILTILTRLVR
jgi:hypothetical protein